LSGVVFELRALRVEGNSNIRLEHINISGAQKNGGINVGNGSTLTLGPGVRVIDNKGGSGILVEKGGTLIMEDGEISGHTAQYGGGVNVDGTFNGYGSTFTMVGGEISDNHATYGGGGVYNHGTFTMNDGTISGNTATINGGGVDNVGTFTKGAGIIYGSDASASLKNNASGNGDAVYSNVGTPKIRNTTAGATVTLDSSTADNWE